MAVKKTEISVPKKGMNRNNHPSELSQNEYTFALNANIQSAQGESDFIITNEYSNLKCTGFKEGYKVVKHLYDRVKNRTYFFLTNLDGCSEIGFISMDIILDPSEIVLKECNCTLSVVIEDGLENVVQEGSCAYNTIISDYCEETDECTGCLDFSLENPVIDVVIRHFKSGDELYFSQVGKPSRYIKLEYIEDYFRNIDKCTGEITDVCLKCDDILIFNKFTFPCITAKTIEIGGALRAGIYEIAVALSNNEGEELSDYIAFTNYVTIINYDNNILDQTSLDYVTNKSITFEINNIDLSYDYYKVVVIYRSGNETTPQYIPFGVFPSSQNVVTISQLPFIASDDRLSSQDILKNRISYLTSEGLVSANGYLFQHTLTSQRTINLQPVVSLMGGFVNWATGASLEKLYKNGVSSALFKGYHRNEVYSLAIQFKMLGGHKTDAYIFIPRPPKPSEIVNIDPEDKNYQSILSGQNNCEDVERDKFWQYHNTAEEIGVLSDCFDVSDSTYTEIIDKNISCESDTYIIEEGTISEEFSGSIVNWINNNKGYIISSSDPSLADIKEALTNGSLYNDCETEGDNCTFIESISEEIIAVDVEGQVMDYDSIPYDKYDPVQPPDNCGQCLTDSSIYDCGFLVDPQQNDVDIEDLLRPPATVYLKTTPSNMSCATALEATQVNVQQPIGTHLIDMGQQGGYNNLITNIPVSVVDQDFKPFLHSNAVFHKVTFSYQEKMVVQLSNIECISTDDNTNNKVRVTVFSGTCGNLNEVPSYGRIISDMTTANDPDKFFVLNSSDITATAQELYVAIDSPMYSDYEVTVELSGTNGSSELNISGNSYTATFDTDISTTTSNFYNANILSWGSEQIMHSITGNVITLRLNKEQYDSLSSQNISGDLEFNIELVDEFHTLQPTCGCHALYKRDPILENVVKYDSITFVKRKTDKYSCSVEILKLSDCGVRPDKYGNFSYWESSLKYPCNSELYDSSSLEIEYTDIPNDIRSDFEEYYTTGITGNVYDLSLGTNFMDKPIRHYKFPDNIVSPFMSSFDINGTNEDNSFNSVIYPIGFKIDNDVINAFLDIALKNDLISSEERSKITGYEIFRGDRRGQKSIVSKGIGFDVLTYADKSNSDELTYYPNYPLNPNETFDSLNGNLSFRLPLRNLFTFHSPETHFNMNTNLPNEILMDGFLKGVSSNTFAPMLDHPMYTILGRKLIQASNVLAGFEVAAEVAQVVAQLLTDGAAGTWVVASVIAAAAGIVSVSITIPFKFNSYRYEWNSIFENLGIGYNHAYIGLAEGQYYDYEKITDLQSTLRSAEIISYLQPGLKWMTKETSGQRYYINNFNRENSVFIKVQDNIPFNYNSNLIDTSRINIPTNSTGLLGIYRNSTYTPYMTISQYNPSQYGIVNSIQWIPTNYCGDLNSDNKCDIIFGGDVYISRFSVKRKFPFFTETSLKLTNKDPFKYSSYFNIKNGAILNRGYIDYKTKIENFGTGVGLPFVKSGFSLWDGSSWVTDSNNSEFYIDDEHKFLTYYFGIPYFLVESEINCWNRYGGIEYHEHFYPQVDNAISWVQPYNVSPTEAEQFRYNFIYSSTPTYRPVMLLPVNYSEQLWNKKDDLSNSVIYSNKDSEDSLIRSPWLNYNTLDVHTFSKEYGELIDITSIESEQILVRFTDGFLIFNTIDILKERLNETNYQLGSGGIFNSRAISFNKTNLGYAGTQHKTIVSTPFGHIWADAKRGKVHLLNTGGSGQEEISLSNDKWFKEHLPFKILKKFPNVNVDRVYNGLGLSIGYDDRGKRILLTKLDYIPKGDNLEWDEDNGFYINTEGIIEKIHYSNKEYFDPAHFTISYSFLTQTWISYYSFFPNYYNSVIDFFQTGVNFGNDDSEVGLWTHNPMIDSYQVFYGKKYPFIIEYPYKTQANNSFVDTVSFYLEVKKYYDYYNSANIFEKGFNKSYIYNNFQHSGLLNLISEKGSDMRQWLQYPKYNTESIDVLQSQIEGVWSFNYILNHIKNDRSGMPMFVNDNVAVNKEINNLNMDYKKSWKDRLRGDYFLVRHIQDDFTQYKMLFRLAKMNRQYYG